MSPASPAVDTQTLACSEGAVGVLVLNRAARLNALTPEMISTLQQQLDCWRDDESIALVVLAGAGERGFCAGGDVHDLIELADPELDATASASFFAAEYRLDYTLHRYPKPVVCWGQGYILGGGMGLMQAARYRLGTPDVQMGMPEVTVGLFPDAGASWFLNRLPEGFGRYLGLTGAMLNTSDALRLGLLDHAVPKAGFADFLGTLETTRWGSGIAANDNRLYRLLQQFAQAHPPRLPEGQLAHYEQRITELCQSGDAAAVGRRILNTQGSAWWESGRDNLARGCPTSAHLLFALLDHGRQMTFADIFRLELGAATHCIRRPDFIEGIKARLIDRNREPRWEFPGLEDVPADYVKSFFISPWSPEAHPLRDL